MLCESYWSGCTMITENKQLTHEMIWLLMQIKA